MFQDAGNLESSKNSKEEMILITGAAGKTGRAVIKALLVDRDHQPEPIRVWVRRPEQVQPMRELGVSEVVVGDLRSQSLLKQAFQGIRIVYHIPPNVHPDELSIAQFMLKTASEAGIERFVYHSVLHPQIEAMPHHWQKMRVEELIFSSGIDFTILQPEVYMQNILSQWGAIVTQGLYSVPYATQTRLGMVDLDDVGMAAAAVLNNSGHDSAIYELAGPDILSQDEIAVILSRLLGINIRAQYLQREVWEERARNAGMDDYQLSTLLRMFEYYERHGFYGNPNVLMQLLNRAPHSFESFIDRIRGEDRLG